MRKRVYLAVVGVSIVVAAVSLGASLTRYLGLLAYSPKGAAQAAAPPAGGSVPSTPPELWNNLFAPGDGMKLASRLPASDAKNPSRAPRTNFVLVGTIVSSAHSARRAVLWANGMKEAKAFREKEEIEPGAILASVERDKVWITRGAEREKLEILPVGSRGRPIATSPSPSPGTAAASPPAGHADLPALPSAAPAMQPPAGRTRTVAAPKRSSDDEDYYAPLTPSGRHRGSLRNRR